LLSHFSNKNSWFNDPQKKAVPFLLKMKRKATSMKDRVRTPLSPMENIGVGALGGALETCLQMPILTYKFCLQEGRPLPLNMVGWYRGVAVQAGTVAPITALQFMVNGVFQKMVLGSSTTRSLTDVEMMATAAGAGAVSAFVYSPVDLITIQQQKMELNPWRTMKALLESHGLSGLYRGLLSCVCREAVYTAGYLGMAPVITSRLMLNDGNPNFFAERPLVASIAGACIAGTVAAVSTHPIDTAKTCVQSDMAGTTWSTALAAIPKLVRQGGIASLYRGIVPRTVRLCGAFFVCLMVRDAAIEFKTKRSHEDDTVNL
jgi:solute carrier family 25 2-oxodicarboxylate transporter 21